MKATASGFLAGAGLLVLLASSSAAFAQTFNLGDFCDGSDFGDDTDCIREWVARGRDTPGSTLLAPAGTFHYHDTFELYSGLKLQCADRNKTTFKNIGGSGTLLAAAAPVKDVRIERCGFDAYGNATDFLAFISVNPGVAEPSTGIRIRLNRFFDSSIRGRMSTTQRQYVLLLNCHSCAVQDNRLSEGGRIKVGRPGEKLDIRRNTVSHANDNAITVVDVGDGVSQDIVIADNSIVQPLAIGIFFGADGESQTAGTLTTRRIVIRDNKIKGDWRTACILGTLPAIADDVQVTGNDCIKTAVNPFSTAGISIKRTNGTPPAATKIVVDANRVTGTGPSLGMPPHDVGGIVFTGNYVDVKVRNNTVKNVGGRAIRFRANDMRNVDVSANTLVGGSIVIEGLFNGTVY